MAIVVKQSDTRVATKRQATLIAEYARLKRMEDLLKDQVETARKALIAEFSDDTSKLANKEGVVLASLVVPSSSGKFDRTAFAKAHPRIHARFWTPGVEGAGTPRLIVNH